MDKERFSENNEKNFEAMVDDMKKTEKYARLYYYVVEDWEEHPYLRILSNSFEIQNTNIETIKEIIKFDCKRKECNFVSYMAKGVGGRITEVIDYLEENNIKWEYERSEIGDIKLFTIS